jgi:uncharacterized membrane protein YkvI
MMVRLLMLADLDYSTTLNSALLFILVGGFVAAVVVGSIAWYNSKKPAGWEGAERPNWIPKVGSDKASSDKSEN